MIYIFIIFCPSDNRREQRSSTKRFKGVLYEYITSELYAYLLDVKDYDAQIRFLKIKRGCGYVKGFIESKM